MQDYDIDEILGRIGSAEMPRHRHSRLLTFRKADGTEHPVGWTPTAELDAARKRTAQRIVGAAREMVASSVMGQEDALAELRDYVTGLSDDFRPASWDPEFMDEYDREQLDGSLRQAMKCALWDDDPFRVAYRMCRSLMIEGDIGIIPVAGSLVRRAAEARARPEMLDHAAEMLCVEATDKSQFMTKVVSEFLDGQHESRSSMAL